MKDLKDIKAGIIYIVKNIHSKDNYFKVGRTTRTVQERLADSWNKSSPSAFSLERGSEPIAIYSVLEPIKVETEIHNALENYRVEAEREWYEIDLDKLKEIVEQIINKSKDNTSIEIEEPPNENNISKEGKENFTEAVVSDSSQEMLEPSVKNKLTISSIIRKLTWLSVIFLLIGGIITILI